MLQSAERQCNWLEDSNRQDILDTAHTDTLQDVCNCTCYHLNIHLLVHDAEKHVVP